MWSRLFRRERSPADPWDLSKPLVRLSGDDVWTIRDSLAGTLITGGTGAGKSTGPGATLARSFLGAGCGALILTAKLDECGVWKQYCKETKRLDDLIVFGSSDAHTFNALDYEASRKGAGAGLTENIVYLYSVLLDIAERDGGGGAGKDDQPYWKQTNRQVTRNTVDLALLAGERLEVPTLYKILISAPTSMEQIRSTEWRSRSLCFQLLGAAELQPKTVSRQQDLVVVADFFLREWPSLSPKTRSIITSMWTSMSDLLMRGILRDKFCAGTTVTPELVLAGKIIVVDFPTKEFGQVGRFAQQLWKQAYQSCVEQRDLSKNARPVVLWADEAQNHVTTYDMQYLTTCRGSRAATVFLTQNVSNFYAALGGLEKGRAEATSIFANLNTKIMCASGDPVTNDWASSLIGRSRQFMANGSTSQSAEDNQTFGIDWLSSPGNTSAGFSETFEWEVQPSEFTQLRTGGPENNWQVDAIVFQNGKRFKASGRTWLPVTFEQRTTGRKGQ